MSASERLHESLAWNERLRQACSADTPGSALLPALQNWQRQRLHLSYADLLEQERYQPACAFFLDELYGGQDFSQRHADLARVEPIMSRMMPDHLLITVAEALEVQALSLELDLAISSQLASQSEDDPQRITQSRYAQAYRNSGSLSQRQQQIELIMHVGQALDSVVHKFWVYRLLKLLRGPAVAAGFGELQGFLETGFAAFKQLAGAEPFLNAIKTREGAAMETIFAGNDQPFAHLAIA